jgi:hypothetical protein
MSVDLSGGDQPQVSGCRIRQNYRKAHWSGRVSSSLSSIPRPFQVLLDQAKGQLAQAEAQLGNAELNVKRDIPETEAHAIPQSQLDTDTQSLRGDSPHKSFLLHRKNEATRTPKGSGARGRLADSVI